MLLMVSQTPGLADEVQRMSGQFQRQDAKTSSTPTSHGTGARRSGPQDESAQKSFGKIMRRA